MTCKACDIAENNPETGHFNVLCDSCKARALAQGMALFESKRAGVKSPEYAEALRKMFGEGNEEAGHARVREWSKKINQQKKGSE